jgi:tetratricopeptide (TPR) repeat protein/transcriptional regulator with XRE-family HTH domain
MEKAMDTSEGYGFGSVLKSFRVREGIKLGEFAKKMGKHRNTVRNWEMGSSLPTFEQIQQVASILLLNEHDRKTLLEAKSGKVLLSPAWNVPHLRNAFFTGREEVLQYLHKVLKENEDKSVALTQSHALSGLGGVGKTQVAIEYAYRFHKEHSMVLWVQADTRDTIIASFLSIAELLNLPEKNDRDQDRVVKATLRWLSRHQGWLLIFDNVDDLEMVKLFLPTLPCGAILLTTRLQATGTIAQSIEIEKMTLEEGVLFLLRRAKILRAHAPSDWSSNKEFRIAKTIWEEMDGLPLAIDQAGAYIENLQCTLSDYLGFYQKRRVQLLKERGYPVSGHPASVATTFTITMEKIQQGTPEAADLLRLCAFLDPDAIPEEIIINNTFYIENTLQTAIADEFSLNAILKVLLTYSLIHRNAQNKTFSIHRLVQAVIKDAIEEKVQEQWVEQALIIVNKAFPEVTYETWKSCQRYLPHALSCASLILQHHLMSLEAARLLNQVGWYLQARAQYSQTEQFLERALSIRKEILGSQHLDTATTLDNLASLYRSHGQYARAEALLKQSLSIKDNVLGREHPLTAATLDNLARLYRDQGLYDQAEPLLMQSLNIKEMILGREHLATAATLNNLARLYRYQDRYEEAELLSQRALSIRETVLGPEHPDTATTLDNLASLYIFMGKFAQAEPLFQRALSIRETVLGPEHPDTATTLDNLAQLFLYRDEHIEAEALFRRALSIRETVLGPEHPGTATILDNLGQLYRFQKRRGEAEIFLRRALNIREKVLGPEHPYTATTTNNLAGLYRDQGLYEQAEPLFQQALSISKKKFGPRHPYTAVALNNLARLYREQGQYDRAEVLFQEALAICESVFSSEHPYTVTVLEDYSILLRGMEREEEAENLQKRAKTIRDASTLSSFTSSVKSL